MKKKSPSFQSNLFGETPTPKSRKSLSAEEKHIRQEESDAHIAWKMLKSNKCKSILTQHQKYLLKKYYSISL